MEQAQQEIHRDIIEKCISGDNKAQFKLYKLYSRAMYNICCRMMNHHAEAEDMLQEAFSEAFLKLNTFKFESTFGAWLKRIVINKCINELKRRKAELVYCEELPMHGEDEEVKTIDYEDIKLSVENVNKAMECLPEGYRVIFSLYLMEGYDHTEIAQILNISESTSKSQYMRAKRKIQNILKSMQP